MEPDVSILHLQGLSLSLSLSKIIQLLSIEAWAAVKKALS